MVIYIFFADKKKFTPSLNIEKKNNIEEVK